MYCKNVEILVQEAHFMGMSRPTLSESPYTKKARRTFRHAGPYIKKQRSSDNG